MMWWALLACTELPTDGPVGRNGDGGAATGIGQEATDLPLIDATGDTFWLADERGKVIFLDMSGFH